MMMDDDGLQYGYKTLVTAQSQLIKRPRKSTFFCCLLARLHPLHIIIEDTDEDEKKKKKWEDVKKKKKGKKCKRIL